MSDNLLDVIRYEGDNSTLVHKHHITNFNTKSQLIVGASQEAIFFKDGEALDSFGPGKHSLNTENVPVIKKLLSKIFGGTNPNQCEVVFVNKFMTLTLGWGTPAPFQMRDPEFGVEAFVKAYGEFGIRISNARKFVIEVLGCENDFSTIDVGNQIRSKMIQYVTSAIPKVLKQHAIGLLDAVEVLENISSKVTDEINQTIAEQIGLTLTNFSLEHIEASGPDFEYRKNERTKLYSEKERMNVLGYTYHDEQRYKIANTAVQNEGLAGTMMGASMGIGMGFGVGGPIGQMVSQTVQSNGTSCPNCNAPLQQAAKFCSGCGASVAPSLSHCISCGAEIPQGARFCSSCGASQVPVQKNCPACNTKLDANARFCPACGQQV